MFYQPPTVLLVNADLTGYMAVFLNFKGPYLCVFFKLEFKSFQPSPAPYPFNRNNHQEDLVILKLWNSKGFTNIQLLYLHQVREIELIVKIFSYTKQIHFSRLMKIYFSRGQLF